MNFSHQYIQAMVLTFIIFLRTQCPPSKYNGVCTGEEDGDAIRMAFSKKQVEDRKTWLSNYVPGTYLDQRNPLIPYKEFIHKVRPF